MKEKGIFECAGCGNPLFKTGRSCRPLLSCFSPYCAVLFGRSGCEDDKFDSGSGWPSFTQPISKDAVKEIKDTSHGMVRIEVVCAKCEGHLGT